MFKQAVAASIAMFLTTPVIAGSIEPAIVEIEPISAPAAEQTSWSGSYIGGNLGYAKSTLTAEGELAKEAKAEGLGQTAAKLDGATAALRGGHDWQTGKLVFGLGAEYTRGNINGGLTGDWSNHPELAGADVDFKIKHTTTVFARAGYLINDDYLAYGLLGRTRARVSGSYSFDGERDTGGSTITGTTFGLGAEYRYGTAWSAYGEYSYTDFGDLNDAGDEMDMDLRQVKLGVNFRF